MRISISTALTAILLVTVAGWRSNSSPDLPVFSFPSDFDRADLEAALHSEHPRLVATENDWQRVRRQLSSSHDLTTMLAALTAAADELLNEPPAERVIDGRRMLFISRLVLKRVLTLGAVYRLTEDKRYLERAIDELLKVAAYDDWNPSHFLDTAEMTLAVAVGYDWLYQDLGETDRATLRQAILEKGLAPGRGSPEGLGLTRWKPGDGVPKAFTRWKEKTNNWNQVCYAGMVAGALAVAEDEPDLAVEFLHDMFSNIGRSLVAYLPDGAYPEGPSYWGYGTQFSVILISLLKSSLGESWNLENVPGFQESAVYINEVIGPTGRFYNYADGGEGVGLMPALHWFAAHQENPAIDTRERDLLASAMHERHLFQAATWGNRLFPLSMLWLDPELAGTKEAAKLPLHWKGEGPNPIAVHRTAWDRDSLYVGIKGGSPSQNHGHMDVGSFVLDDQGVRWAIDIKGQGYISLEKLGMDIWDYSQKSDRWRVFNLNTHGHNTLVIDGQHQMVGGFAPIHSFSSDPENPFTVVDMSTVYSDWAVTTVRGVRLLDAHAVMFSDRLSGLDNDRSVRWGMVTKAKVELDGNRAILRLGGKTLHATILEPIDTNFEVVPTDPPPNKWDAPNPGTRMLALFAANDQRPLCLKVVFSRGPLTPSEIEELRALPDPIDW